MRGVTLISQLAFLAQATKEAVDRLVEELFDRARPSSISAVLATGEDLDGTANGKPARTVNSDPFRLAPLARGGERLSSFIGLGLPRVQGRWTQVEPNLGLNRRLHAKPIGAQDRECEPGNRCTGSPYWSERELHLYSWSQGMFNPDRMATSHRRVQQPGGVPGRVTMCCPTMESRHDFHQQLWAVFDAMAWDDKELVVVETFHKAPSPFLEAKARKDERFIYLPFRRPEGEDWSIGLKRNMCNHVASGEIIAQMDDDDIYAPTYVSTMVHALHAKKATAVTLSTWYLFEAIERYFALIDCKANADQKRETFKDSPLGFLVNIDSLEDSWIYGFGFSYVYYRSAALDLPYENINMSEDYRWCCRLRESHYVHALRDPTGIVLHTLHGGSMSWCHMTREVPFSEFLNLEVAEHARLLKDYYPDGEMPDLPSDFKTARAVAFAGRLQAEGLSVPARTGSEAPSPGHPA